MDDRTRQGPFVPSAEALELQSRIAGRLEQSRVEKRYRAARRVALKRRAIEARIAAVKDLALHSAGPGDLGRLKFTCAPTERFVTGLALSAPERLLLSALLSALLAGHRGLRLSAEELGRACGCTGRWVRAMLPRLRALGLINVVHDYLVVSPYRAKSNGRIYTRRQVRNVITLGWLGRERFAKIVPVDNAVDNSVDNFGSGTPSHTRNSLPSNRSRDASSGRSVGVGERKREEPASPAAFRRPPGGSVATTGQLLEEIFRELSGSGGPTGGRSA